MPHPWKDLIAWQKAHELVIEIYKVTESFPEKELFVLVRQIRRSSTSVAANIVEGKSRKTDKELSSFPHNARGSLEETRYHLILARELNYLNKESYNHIEDMAAEVSYLLNKLISTVMNNSH